MKLFLALLGSAAALNVGQGATEALSPLEVVPDEADFDGDDAVSDSAVDPADDAVASLELQDPAPRAVSAVVTRRSLAVAGQRRVPFPRPVELDAWRAQQESRMRGLVRVLRAPPDVPPRAETSTVAAASAAAPVDLDSVVKPAPAPEHIETTTVAAAPLDLDSVDEPEPAPEHMETTTVAPMDTFISTTSTTEAPLQTTAARASIAPAVASAVEEELSQGSQQSAMMDEVPNLDVSKDDEDDSDSDSHAMMMYYKGRVGSTLKENARLKDMLQQAGAWGKAMKEKFADLDSENRENQKLKARLDSLHDARSQIDTILQDERNREHETERHVHALEWVKQKLGGAQEENAELKTRIENATRVDSDLSKQLEDSDRGRSSTLNAEQAMENQVVTANAQKKSVEEALRKQQQSLSRDEKALQAAAHDKENAKKLRDRLQKKNALLKRNLKKLLAEKRQERQLQKLIQKAKASDAGLVDLAHGNQTLLSMKLTHTEAEGRTLESTMAKTMAKIAAEDALQKEAEETLHKIRSQMDKREILANQAADGENELQKEADHQQQVADAAAHQEQLADEARDAAASALSTAKAAMVRLRSQRGVQAQENQKLQQNLGKAAAEEKELFKQAMGSATPPVAPATSTPPPPTALISEAEPIDVPSMDVSAD